MACSQVKLDTKIFSTVQIIPSDRKIVKGEEGEKSASKSEAGDHRVEDLLLIGAEFAGRRAVPERIDVAVDANRSDDGMLAAIGVALFLRPGFAANLHG